MYGSEFGRVFRLEDHRNRQDVETHRREEAR